jgi:hypothetical protein
VGEIWKAEENDKMVELLCRILQCGGIYDEEPNDNVVEGLKGAATMPSWVLGVLLIL